MAKHNSAFTSGMRGSEKPPSHGPRGNIGNPDGETPGSLPGAQATPNPTLQQHTSDAYKIGDAAGASTENAAEQVAPTVEEDDTHINVKIPKSSLGKKKPGVHGA